MNDPAKPLTNTQRAIDELRSLIFSGELQAGSDHLEADLARRLSMSRTPIRAAALTLEGQGLLELRPRKGVRILPVSTEDVHEIFDILTELESHAAARAAETGYSDADLTALSTAVSRMDFALTRGARESWDEAEDLFHEELVRLGGNLRLVRIVDMMRDQVRRPRYVTLGMRPMPTDSDDHRDVLNAIRNQEPELARRVHRNHRQRVKSSIIEVLERHSLSAV